MERFSTKPRAKFSVILQQLKRGNPEPPEKQLFFLNTPPRKPGKEYIILENGIIEADKIIMA